MTDEKPDEKPLQQSVDTTGSKPNTTAPKKPTQEPTHEKIEGISSVSPHSPRTPPEQPKKRSYHRKAKPKIRPHIHELLGLE